MQRKDLRDCQFPVLSFIYHKRKKIIASMGDEQEYSRDMSVTV